LSTASMHKRIEQIKAELVNMGDMRPGTLSEHYKVCGNASCSCRNPKDPRKHGPYLQLNYTHKGRSRTEFVRRDQQENVRRQLENYARFRALIDEWVELSIEIARAGRQRADKGVK